MSSPDPTTRPTTTTNEETSLSPLEQQVLDEYVRLAGNLGDVCFSLSLSPSLPITSSIFFFPIQMNVLVLIFFFYSVGGK
jgi:hypothetical protein